MNTTDRGRQAEAAVTRHLKERGYRPVAANWRTRLCEIDLIVVKDGVIYCVEVKYRITPDQGDGFEHITLVKRRQMELAANIWVTEHAWDGDYRLMAAAVSGPACEVIEIVEL